MSDDRSNRGQPDRSRISLGEDYELRYWTTTLGVGPQEIMDAIGAVGDSPERVREYLKHRRHTIPQS
jgi:hypothetical protein